MRSPRIELRETNAAIEKALKNVGQFDRGFIAQDIVQDLRNLTEHVLVYAIFGADYEPDDYYKAIKTAVAQAKGRADLKFLTDFWSLLQKVVSHYTPSESASERLMLGYLEHLTLLRQYAKDALGIEVLSNLELFPINQDPTLENYYSQVAEKFDLLDGDFPPTELSGRFYISSCRPFFVSGRMFFETSFIPAYDNSSKYDKVVAFSRRRISDSYSMRLTVSSANVRLFDTTIPITLILDAKASIRPCEMEKLMRIVGFRRGERLSKANREDLMSLVAGSGLRLDEICCLPESVYGELLARHFASPGSSLPRTFLDKCRMRLAANGPGSCALKYLLAFPRNRVLKNQESTMPNRNLGGLYLANGVIPFDKNPFSFSLKRHNPSFAKVFTCIDAEGREQDLLARRVSGQTEGEKCVYACDSTFADVENIDSLVERYNASLHPNHRASELVHADGQVFIRGNEESLDGIVRSVLALTDGGVRGYQSVAQTWLTGNMGAQVDDPEKRTMLTRLFASSKVACIYGSAGTGKTLMIQYVCNLLSGAKKIAVANTNSAVDNLRQRVLDPNCSYQTVCGYLASDEACDLLIVDECSTVCNRDMLDIARGRRYKAMLLVGDVRQIDSIDFGSWFEQLRVFIPDRCVFELVAPWRTQNKALLDIWGSVRVMNGDVRELLEANRVSHALDGSLFRSQERDEIVLCLNYSGMYGINNINRVLQSQNPGRAYVWGVHEYAD